MRRELAALLLAAALPARAAVPGWDPAIRRGVLDNGLTYVIARHETPAARFSARLVLKAGSLGEEQGEQGLMHLLEHLGFQGSSRFPPGEMIRRLEAHGSSFGAHHGAETSFDSVRYERDLPAGPEELGLALDVLADWAGGATLSDELIEKERGVVLAEWRLAGAEGREAADRAADVAFSGTRVPLRQPIGLEGILLSAPPQRIRELYRKWWRPDLMAVVLVGDVDAAAVESAVVSRLGALPPGVGPPPRVPDAGAPTPGVVALASRGGSRLSLSWSRAGPTAPGARERFEQELLDEVATRTFTRRLQALSLRGELPVTDPEFGVMRVAGLQPAWLAGTWLPGRIPEGVEALTAEVARMSLHGPAPGEVERAKAEVLRERQGALARLDSPARADAMAQDFLDGVETWSPETLESELPRNLRSVTAADVREWFREAANAPRRTALVTGRSKGPSREELVAAMERGAAAVLEAPNDESVSRGLIDSAPDPVRPRHRERDEATGGEWLTFGNGLRVLVVPTRHARNEVLVGAWRREDHLGDSREEQAAAALAVHLLPGIGVAGRTGGELRAWLQSHHAELSARPHALGWELLGAATSDVDPLLQRLHALFTAPEMISPEFDELRERAAVAVEHSRGPSIARLQLEAQAVVQGEGGWLPAKPAELRAVTAEAAHAAWSEARADAAQWIVVLVGDTTFSAAAAAASRWLGTLPGSGAAKATRPWPEMPSMRPGHRRLTVPRRSEASVVASGCRLRAEGPPSSQELHLIAQVIGRRLLQRLRFDGGEAYAVRVGIAEMPPLPGPVALMAFADAPEGRHAEVTRVLHEELRDIVARGPGEAEAAQARRERLLAIDAENASNEALRGSLLASAARSERPRSPGRRAAEVNAITPDDLRRAARRTFDLSRTFEVAIVPSRD